MSRHVSEINLPVLAWMMSTKLVHRLMYMENSLWIGLGIHLTVGVNLWNENSEMGGVKEAFLRNEKKKLWVWWVSKIINNAWS